MSELERLAAGDPDNGKVRVYSCLCGQETVQVITWNQDYPRELTACPTCGSPLAGQPYRIEDHKLYVYRMLAAHGHDGATQELKDRESL